MDVQRVMNRITTLEAARKEPWTWTMYDRNTDTATLNQLKKELGLPEFEPAGDLSGGLDINKAIEDEKTQGLLVVGTENKEILVLDKTGMDIQKSIKLPAVGVFMITQGSYDVDYKIFIACRNVFTYQIKNGKISSSFQVHIESKPTGLVKLDKTIVISGMNQNLYSFYNKGR